MSKKENVEKENVDQPGHLEGGDAFSGTKSSAVNIVGNPLQRDNEEEVVADAAEFCKTHGLAVSSLNLSFPTEFGINGTGTDEWIVGAVNSIIFLTAAGLIGAWIVDPLNHYFGRRGEIFLTALVLFATPIGSGFTHSWQTLFVVKFILGIGIGAKNATVPIFSSELAPARIRGALVMFWQLWVTFGIFAGFAANVIVRNFGKIALRLQLGETLTMGQAVK
ncbi:hypothetical protein DFH08DRAFT_971320 [Mycena albidolilacea]|uniref:Major facilitator superfamily (MFS) profile domain-containing protein n=1 Tax=Mycena albidolilacea TaxID=1033008 RepID=A0AAD7EF88_9AGAR|nr:hypothetical protein DFH08DRAFT_971320 [Mycena albidolilacea]